MLPSHFSPGVRRYRAALRRSLAKLRQALQRQRKTSRPQSTALHLEVITSRSKTSLPGLQSEDETMTPQTGREEMWGKSHVEEGRDCPSSRPCHRVEVNGDRRGRDTEGTGDRDRLGDSTTHLHSPTMDITGQKDIEGTKDTARENVTPLDSDPPQELNTDRDFP